MHLPVFALFIYSTSSTLLRSTINAVPVHPPGTGGHPSASTSPHAYQRWPTIEHGSKYSGIASHGSFGSAHFQPQHDNFPQQIVYPTLDTTKMTSPDAGKGAKFHFEDMVFDSKNNRIIKDKSASQNDLVRQEPSVKNPTSKHQRSTSPKFNIARNNGGVRSWKDGFPSSIMMMSDILAKHIGVKRITAYRLLSKHGNKEIAQGLLSGNANLQKEAVEKLPVSIGRRGGSRKTYLGHQASEITGNYMKMHGITRKQATDKLGNISKSVADLLKDPNTFEETARKLTLRQKGQKPFSRTKAVSKAAPDVKKTSLQDANIVESNSDHHIQHSLWPTQSFSSTPPSSPQSHLHSFVSSDHHSKSSDDSDYIDFAAIEEFVNSNRNKGGHS